MCAVCPWGLEKERKKKQTRDGKRRRTQERFRDRGPKNFTPETKNEIGKLRRRGPHDGRQRARYSVVSRGKCAVYARSGYVRRGHCREASAAEFSPSCTGGAASRRVACHGAGTQARRARTASQPVVVRGVMSHTRNRHTHTPPPHTQTPPRRGNPPSPAHTRTHPHTHTHSEWTDYTHKCSSYYCTYCIIIDIVRQNKTPKLLRRVMSL